MGKARNWFGLIALALGLAGQIAYAGERKSTVGSLDGVFFAERLTVPFVASRPGDHTGFAFTPAGAFDARAEHFVDSHTGTTADQRERATGPIDRNITLFHFQTKSFGEVGVHPLLGNVKGLQVSVGF